MSLADTFFDNSLRVDSIVWLAAIGDQPCESFEDFVTSRSKSTSELAAELLGITPKQWDKLADDADDDRDTLGEIASRFARRRIEGFLVHVATPSPIEFLTDGGCVTYGFGCCTLRWFYTETLDAAFAAKAVKWKKEYYAAEKKKASKAAKKGGD